MVQIGIIAVMKILAILLSLLALAGCSDQAPAFTARATSYTANEPDHIRFGHLNCQSHRLDETQCAADLSIYPLGTIVRFRYLDGAMRGLTDLRVVADCGSKVRGAFHFDLYRSSRSKMFRLGTQRVEAQIVRWSGFVKKPRGNLSCRSSPSFAYLSSKQSSPFRREESDVRLACL